MTADSQPPIGGFLFLTTVGVLTALLHLSRMHQGEEDIESESQPLALDEDLQGPAALVVVELPEDAGLTDPNDPGGASTDDSGPEAGQLTRQTERAVLALARICVSEAGFTLRTRDCELIYHVLLARSGTGELKMSTMRAYCKKSFNKGRTDSHRWVAHLNSTGREPQGWSETTTVPWSRRRAAWMRVLEHTRSLIRTRPENPCGDRLDHWGSKGFRKRRHLRNGWRIVECGETLNEFWALPVRTPR